MRTIPATTRRALESPDSPDALLVFLTITHPGLADAIRVVSDVLDYSVDGQTFIGMPFGFRQLSDNDAGARTQIVVQAVDRRISKALLAAQSRAKVKAEVRSSADFDLSVVPRVEIVSSPPIYGFFGFDLINVTGDATQISGDVEIADYTVEPWPSIAGTQDRLPGLYR